MSTDRNEVAKYLADVRKSIQEKRCVFAAREKNEQLFVKFIFSEQMREEILLNLEVEDFCGVLQNEHPNFAHERLYVFGKEVWMIPRYGGEKRLVSLYIKINKLDGPFCIVISFHEQERPLKYVFD